MSKKQLNTESITNELEGASLFFQRGNLPNAPKTDEPQTDTVIFQNEPPTPPALSGTKARDTEPKSERPNVRTNGATNGRKAKRSKIRHTFDIFADQLHDLQALQLKAVQAGKRKPTLGKMVQQALDWYLARQPKRKSKRA
jgi:hypothetical protein